MRTTGVRTCLRLFAGQQRPTATYYTYITYPLIATRSVVVTPGAWRIMATTCVRRCVATLPHLVHNAARRATVAATLLRVAAVVTYSYDAAPYLVRLSADDLAATGLWKLMYNNNI